MQSVRITNALASYRCLQYHRPWNSAIRTSLTYSIYKMTGCRKKVPWSFSRSGLTISVAVGTGQCQTHLVKLRPRRWPIEIPDEQFGAGQQCLWDLHRFLGLETSHEFSRPSLNPRSLFLAVPWQMVQGKTVNVIGCRRTNINTTRKRVQ